MTAPRANRGSGRLTAEPGRNIWLVDAADPPTNVRPEEPTTPRGLVPAHCSSLRRRCFIAPLASASPRSASSATSWWRLCWRLHRLFVYVYHKIHYYKHVHIYSDYQKNSQILKTPQKYFRYVVAKGYALAPPTGLLARPSPPLIRHQYSSARLSMSIMMYARASCSPRGLALGLDITKMLDQTSNAG